MSVRTAEKAEPQLPYITDHKKFPRRPVNLGARVRLRELKQLHASQRYSSVRSSRSHEKSGENRRSVGEVVERLEKKEEQFFHNHMLKTTVIDPKTRVNRSYMSESLPQSPTVKKAIPVLARRHFQPHRSSLDK